MKHNNLTSAILFLSLMLPSPLLRKGGAAFAQQNTFMYEVCYGGDNLTPGDIAILSDLSTHQIPSDSGYIAFAKAHYNAVSNNYWSGFCASKLDKNGNLEWTRIYKDTISKHTHKLLYDGIPTSDSGFVMAGAKYPKTTSNFGQEWEWNTYVQKTDKDGHELWAKVYKISNNNQNHALKILQMPDEGYIVMGITKDPTYSGGYHNLYPYYSFNTYLLRLDKNGNALWCYYYDAGQYGEEQPLSLEMTYDGGFIIAGNTDNDTEYGFTRTTQLDYTKGFMMKVSADGATVEWAKRYGEQGFPYGASGLITRETFNEVKQTPDSGYIAIGTTPVIDKDAGAWIVKTDSKGAIEWQKTYSNYNLKEGSIEIKNDGYMIVGSNGLTKLNLFGEIEWAKEYSIENVGYSNMGFTPNNTNLTMDGGFVTSLGHGYPGANLSSNKIILKTNSLGEFEDGCIYPVEYPAPFVDIRTEMAYPLSPVKENNVPVEYLAIVEDSVTGRKYCPVVCSDIPDIAIAPNYFRVWQQVCAGTDASLFSIPVDNTSYTIYFHSYKIDFGDPVSGQDNFMTGSVHPYGLTPITHNYASPGVYTITLVVFNNDLSKSDTVTTEVVVVPQPKITLLTPEINVCKKDTVILSALIDNYQPFLIKSWWEEKHFTSWNETVLSQTFTQKGNSLSATATVLADISQDYYVLELHDSYDACTLTDTVWVKVGDNEAVISGNTQICSGAASTLQASGGDSYLWSTGATTSTTSVSPSSNKTYWVEATSLDGCRDTAFVYMQMYSEINVEAWKGNGSLCEGDSLMIYASGAKNYSWSNGDSGDSIWVVLAQGQNSFLVTGTSGTCTDTASIVVTGYPIPVPRISGPAMICKGVEFTLTASGGDSYYWFGPAYTPSQPESKFIQVGGGNRGFAYKVTVSNGSCSATAEHWVNTFDQDSSYGNDNDDTPDIGGISADQCRVCPGTEVTLRKYFEPIPPGYFRQDPLAEWENKNLTYLWSTGKTASGLNDSIKITVIRDTTITLITTNAGGCSITNSIRLHANPYFYINTQPDFIPSCTNSPTTIYVMGNYLDDFTWGNGIKEDTLVVSPLQDSMLYITATVNSCTRTDSVFVYAKSNLPKAKITGNAIVCTGTPTTYSVTGNAAITSYQWLSDNSTNSTITISPTNNLTLKALITFSLGCTDTATYAIQVKTATTPTVSGNTQICPGGTVELTATGGYTYQWNTGSSSNKVKITTPKDSTIKVIISNNGCSNDTISVGIFTNKTITATLFSDEDTICSGTPLTLIAGGGDIYNWSTGEKGEMIGIVPPITTNYEVKAEITADNCADIANITITVKPAPTLSVSGETSLCLGKNTNLVAVGSGSYYVWSTGDSTASIIVSPAKDSAYSVSTFIGDCYASQNHVVTVIASGIDAGPDQTVLQGTEVTLIPTGGLNYNWSTVDGLICSNCNTIYDSPTQTTTYYLSETGVLCGDDSVTVYVLNCSNIFVPNAFSPNSDGANDILYLKNDCIKQLEFKIFDRWGNKVFQSADVTNGWDGTHKGKEMDAAVFVYYVNAVLLSGEPINKKGNVSLVR